MEGHQGGYIAVGTAAGYGIRLGTIGNVVSPACRSYYPRACDCDRLARPERFYSDSSHTRFKHSLQDWQRASWSLGYIPGFSTMRIGGDVNGT